MGSSSSLESYKILGCVLWLANVLGQVLLLEELEVFLYGLSAQFLVFKLVSDSLFLSSLSFGDSLFLSSFFLTDSLFLGLLSKLGSLFGFFLGHLLGIFSPLWNIWFLVDANGVSVLREDELEFLVFEDFLSRFHGETNRSIVD